MGPRAARWLAAASLAALCGEASAVWLRHRSRWGDEPESAKELDAGEFGTMGFMDSYMAATKESGIKVDDDADLPPPNATAEALLPRRTLVVARYDEDDAWLKNLPKNIDVVVYQSKDQGSPHFVENFGNEASKYLSYIVDHYDSLPDTLAFVQAGRQDWHDPLPKDRLMRKWDWERAAQQGGMAFLPTAAPCLVERQEEEAPGSKPPLLHGNGDCQAVEEHVPKQMAAVREAWGTIFEEELGALPQRWLTHCCAQFEVTREAVQQHPLRFYEGLLAWSLQHDRSLAASDYAKDMKRNHDPDRRDAGHIMEPVWVLLFGQRQ